MTISTILAIVCVLALAVTLLLPRSGLIARWRQGKAEKTRPSAENALKHAYDCEYRGVACTIESIAGSLGLSTDAAARLVTRLDSMGLLRPDQTALRLTPEGRAYALRVIRIHRLWERYLADETSVRDIDWHQRAEQQEHLMTPADADRLAAQLGNPQFDPAWRSHPHSWRGSSGTTWRAIDVAGSGRVRRSPAH